jgi:hypothetical protein
MTRKSPRLRAIYGALFVGDAVALPLIFYTSGFPTVGGALLLSSVLVFTIAIIKSGALGTSWLAGETRAVGDRGWSLLDAVVRRISVHSAVTTLSVPVIDGRTPLKHASSSVTVRGSNT